MIHMLSAFDLTPGADFAAFRAAYTAFVDEAHAAGIIAASGPLGQRVSDTPMDTDAARSHRYYSVLSFRDRAQLDAAYAHIAAAREPGSLVHGRVFRMVADAVFTCWQDMDGTG